MEKLGWQFLFERIVANGGVVDQIELKEQMVMRYPSAKQFQVEDDVNRFIEWLLERKVLIRG